jgi:hypothetical protein
MHTGLVLGAFLGATRAFCQVGEYVDPSSIPESQIVFVAEGRIGNAAGAGAPTEFELDIGATTAAPADTADFPWMSGQSEVFRVQYDPALLTNGNRFVQFFVGASNVVYELPSTVYTNAASGCGDVYIRTRSAKTGGSITNINISVTVAGQTVPLVHNSVGSSGGNDVDVIKIGGQLLQAGFLITGNTTLAWNPSNKPARSQLAFQIKFTECPAIASVEWREADPEAGFTNLTNDNPASHGGGFRLFAEQNVPGGSVHSNVIARANFVNPIPAGQTNAVYFRLFDVDDPTQNYLAATNMVNVADPNDVDADTFDGDDNRLSAGGTGLGASPADIVCTNVVGPADWVDFRYHITDRQPGNNWKLVASCSSNYLSAVTLDITPTGGGTNFLFQATPTNTVMVSTNIVSPLLSVWRTLHVEVDSMSNVVDNVVAANITSITGNAMNATELGLDINLRTGLNPQDNSNNLDTGTVGNGRFENGDVAIGFDPFAALHPNADLVTTNFVDANGDSRLVNANGFDIPSRIVVNPLFGAMTNDTGQVVGLTGNTFTVSADLGTNNFTGAQFDVPGASFLIFTNSASTITVLGVPPKMPFILHDDDGDSIMPTNLNNAAVAGLLEEKYRPAYILPKIDGGGDPNNNKLNVPFVLNVDTTSFAAMNAVLTSANALESDGNRANGFWVAYVLTAFQGHPYDAVTDPSDIRGDTDPNSEPRLAGVTSELEGIGSLLFMEEIRDFRLQSSTDLTAPGFAHETAHQFDLIDCNPCPGDFMGPDFFMSGSKFSVPDIVKLRQRVRSPGRKP